MRFARRVLAGASAVLLVGLTGAPTPVGAADAGVGTASASTSLVGVQLGDGTLLDVDIVTDASRATTDPAVVADGEAFSKLSPLHIGSTVGALNHDAPALETRQPGGEATKQTAVSLSPAGLTEVVDGALNLANLSSTVDEAGARSALTAALADVKVAGALANVQAVNSTLSTSAQSDATTATRSVGIDALTVLNLGSFLAGLGINPLDLTVGQIEGLLAVAGVDVPGLEDGTSLNSTVDDVQAKVTELEAALADNTGLVDGTADEIVAALGLTEVIGEDVVAGITGTAAEQTQALIDALQDAVADLLAEAVKTVDALALLKVNGLEVAVTAKAVEAVEDSEATVKGVIGSVTVGDKTVPGVSLDKVDADIDAAEALVKTTVDDLLAEVGVTIDDVPVDLAGTVAVDLWANKVEETTSSDGYTRAKAGVTALQAKVTPPEALADLVEAIGEQAGSVGSLIEDNEGTPPEVAASMGELNGALGTTSTALGSGAGVNAVEVLGSADYTRNAPAGGPADPPGTSLAATGSSTLPWTALALLLIALGVGLRSWLDLPLPRFGPR